LDLGGFGYDSAARVAWLPENYRGPLCPGDRFVAVGGKAIRDGREYAAIMEEQKEEKAIVVTVERGKEKLRLETRVLLAKREELITARVQARYEPDLKEILILSRTVAEMRVTIPAQWTPAAISWNGSDVLKAESAGCWILNGEKDPPSARACEK
ncbi:MAG: hypothetical protein ACRD96_09495, partial [Bryobacteraceae bacterium]